MARSLPWRRSISDLVSWRQNQALNSTMYILRQTGPTAFLLKEEGEDKTLKVFLGDPHRCTCQNYQKDRDLCSHICWILLKRYKLSRRHELSWQGGLVEREINAILRGEADDTRPIRAAVKKPEREAGELQQRAITEEDVCPICQEGLLEKHQPVTFCRNGCGNNVHISCMRIYASHQKDRGQGQGQKVLCPLCREEFCTQQQLMMEVTHTSVRAPRTELLNQHVGLRCATCHDEPIVGKCYRCTTCADYYMCQKCFNSPCHSHHVFQYRQKRHQRWRHAERGDAGTLPAAMVTNIQERDLEDDDYDTLLQLDREVGSDLSQEALSMLPVQKVRGHSSLLAPGAQCRICLRPYREGDTVRRLPCEHRFHCGCVDAWLLHRAAACPLDGATFSSQAIRNWVAARRRRAPGRAEAAESPAQCDVSGLAVVGHRNGRRAPAARVPGSLRAATASGAGAGHVAGAGLAVSGVAADTTADLRRPVIPQPTEGRDERQRSAQGHRRPAGDVHLLPPVRTPVRTPVAPSIPLPCTCSQNLLSAGSHGNKRIIAQHGGSVVRGRTQMQPTGSGSSTPDRRYSAEQSGSQSAVPVAVVARPPRPAASRPRSRDVQDDLRWGAQRHLSAEAFHLSGSAVTSPPSDGTVEDYITR